MTMILDKDWVAPGEVSWEIGVKALDEGKNIRMVTHINQPAGSAFYEILERPGQPPMLVIVTRADAELMTLGILEKSKITVMNYQRRNDQKARLAEGVTSALGIDLTKGRPS